MIHLGYVPERHLGALYNGARALVYPSLYEGFGFPVLEAMACATPVVTSDVSALPEVAGDAAILVSPGDVDAIAGGMDRVLRDDGLRESLAESGPVRAASFRWEDTARRTVRILRDAGAP